MTQKTKKLICIAIGVAGLLFCGQYAGPGAGFLHSHGANVTFSFGAYFILSLCRLPLIERKPINAAYTFLGVSVQEVAQGLELYPGIFDPLDFLANAVGVCCAWVADVWVLREFPPQTPTGASDTER